MFHCMRCYKNCNLKHFICSLQLSLPFMKSDIKPVRPPLSYNKIHTYFYRAAGEEAKQRRNKTCTNFSPWNFILHKIFIQKSGWVCEWRKKCKKFPSQLIQIIRCCRGVPRSIEVCTQAGTFFFLFLFDLSFHYTKKYFEASKFDEHTAFPSAQSFIEFRSKEK